MGFVPLQGTQQSVVPVSITEATTPLQRCSTVRALALRPPLIQDNPSPAYFTQVRGPKRLVETSSASFQLPPAETRANQTAPKSLSKLLSHAAYYVIASTSKPKLVGPTPDTAA